MRKRIIEWLVKKFLPGYHLHRDPLRKTDLSKVWGTGSPLEEGEEKHERDQTQQFGA